MNNNFYKRGKKKLEIKIMRTKLENIISSIWTEWQNLEPLNLLLKDQEKKLEILKIRTTLENIIIGKLGLNDEK
jgi:hypothetical protein